MNDQKIENRIEPEQNEDSERRKKKIRRITSQFLAASAKNTILFASGLSIGFPTILIPNVQSSSVNSTLTLTDEEVTWLGSIALIMNPIGCLLSGITCNLIGRKRSMMLLTIPILLYWLLFYFASSPAMLLSATAIVGITLGLLIAPIMTYVSEISEPHLRGILSLISSYTTIFGIFAAYLLGSFLDWRTVSVICVGAPVICFIVLVFVPESPYWLISKRRFDEAEKALCWLRGWTTKGSIQEEYDQLLKVIHPQEDANGCDIKKYFRKTLIHPLLLLMFSSGIVHFTGLTTVSTFAINILKTYGAPIDPYLATVLMGLARFLGPLATTFFILHTGRRPLVFFSVIGLFILCGTVGLYGYLYLGITKMDNGVHVEELFGGAPNYSWLPMVCLIAIPLMSCLGVNTALWLMIVLTLPGVFLLFAVVALASLAVFYFLLPETEGWSLVEIEEHFAGIRNLVKAGRKKGK